ncbi:MAG: hypothetical protein KAT00_00395 [Planctomycetes bacterium]|nr:hypothetical protein [Planctomycetota bacterium]
MKARPEPQPQRPLFWSLGQKQDCARCESVDDPPDAFEVTRVGGLVESKKHGRYMAIEAECCRCRAQRSFVLEVDNPFNYMKLFARIAEAIGLSFESERRRKLVVNIDTALEKL